DRALDRRRQSPVARLLRARVQSQLAMMTGQVADAEKALEYLRHVDLPESPLLLAARVEGELTAAHHYSKIAGDLATQARSDELFERAGKDAELLGKFPDAAPAVLTRCNYFLVTGNEESLLREIQEAHVKPGLIWFLEVGVLYGQGQFERALEALERTKASWDQPSYWTVKGMLLASMPGKEEEAEAAIQESFRAIKGGTVLALYQAPLHWLGPEGLKTCQKLSKDVRQHRAALIPPWRQGWYRDLLAFHAGELSADEL